MTRTLFAGVFGLGVLALGWVATGFLGSNVLALFMTLTIAAVYMLGAVELHRFRQATDSLTSALSALAAAPADQPGLSAWLASVHGSLRNPVRLRIEGERVGLPGPALTPYLVGLLVMLGMLGTFLGMVVTLNGAVFALEGTTDLQAIRTAFAAPIKGLGLSFGTSVAGVAASAMLGLMSAIARRERTMAAQQLDTAMATTLRGFSLTHQRQETYKALQLQSQALPVVADQMQAMMAQMERMSQQLADRLLANQQGFHRDVQGVYAELANSVGQSLRDSVAQSANAVGASLRPVVEAAMTGIAQEARLMHERMVDTTQTQLDALSARFGTTASTVTDTWTATLAQQERTHAEVVSTLGLSLQEVVATLRQDWQHITGQAQASASQTLDAIAKLTASSEELVRSRIASEAAWTEQHHTHMDQAVTMVRTELTALRDDEALRGQAAVERLGELQTALTSHLTTLGTALEEPITRLIETASQAPRAAAEVIGKLRQEVSSSAARDNDLLEERARIMATLSALLDAINHASVEQRAVIDSLVASSALALQHAGGEFAQKVDAEAAKLADIAANVTSSAVEVSALSESFGFAVSSFNDANEKLITNLQRIEGAMDKSMARSDEQLAYYVAQAREIIDLSILSQKEVFEALRQLPAQPAPLAEELA